MKKIIVLMLVGSMTLSLVACGKTADVAEPESVAVEKPSVVESVEETVEPASTEEASTEEEAEEVEFTTGEVVNGAYENSLLGIKFIALDGMTFASEDRLAELSSSTADVLKDNAKVLESMKDGSVIIVCYANTDVSTMPVYTFNITMQSEDSVKAAGTLTEDRILESAKPQIESALKAQGLENLEAVIEPADFLGEKHTSLYITADYPGVGKFFEREFIIIKNGYVASYTASEFGSDADNLVDVFDNVESIE